MGKRCLSLFLILLIALQSVFAIAIEHPIHSDKPEHTTFEHSSVEYHEQSSLNEDQASTTQNLDNTQDIQLDCHHCHGCSHLFIDVVLVGLGYEKRSFSFPFYQKQYIQPQLSSNFRPPIV